MSLTKTAIAKTAALGDETILRALALGNRYAAKHGLSDDAVSEAAASFGAYVPDGKGDVPGACDAAMIRALKIAHVDDIRRNAREIAAGDATDVGMISPLPAVEYAGGTARPAVGSHVGAALAPLAPDHMTETTDTDRLRAVLSTVPMSYAPLLAAIARPAHGQRVRPGIGAILRAAGMADGGRKGPENRATVAAFIADLQGAGRNLTTLRGPSPTARAARPIIATRANVTYPGGACAVDGRGPQVGWHHGATEIPIFPINGEGEIGTMTLPAVPFTVGQDSPAGSFDRVKGTSPAADGLGSGMRVGYGTRAGTGRTADAMFIPRDAVTRAADAADRLDMIGAPMRATGRTAGLDHMPSWVGSAPDPLPMGAVRTLPDGTPVYCR